LYPLIQVIENHTDLDLLHLIPVLPRPHILSVSAFQYGERGLHQVPPVVEIFVEVPGEFSPVPSSDPFPLPVPDRYDRMSSQLFPDLAMETLGIVPLVQDIRLRPPNAVTPPQEGPGMNDIMTEVLGDPDAGDHLFVGIYRNRGFEIAPPGGSGPPSVVGAGIGASDPGGIDGGDRDHLTPEIEEVDHLLENNIEVDRPDTLQEFLQGGEVRDLLQLQNIPDSGHHLQEIDDTPVIHPQDLFQQDQGQVLVLGIGSPRIFAGIERDSGALYHRQESLQ
jgi:hypothetical protein